MPARSRRERRRSGSSRAGGRPRAAAHRRVLPSVRRCPAPGSGRAGRGSLRHTALDSGGTGLWTAGALPHHRLAHHRLAHHRMAASAGWTPQGPGGRWRTRTGSGRSARQGGGRVRGAAAVVLVPQLAPRAARCGASSDAGATTPPSVRVKAGPDAVGVARGAEVEVPSNEDARAADGTTMPTGPRCRRDHDGAAQGHRRRGDRRSRGPSGALQGRTAPGSARSSAGRAGWSAALDVVHARPGPRLCVT